MQFQNKTAIVTGGGRDIGRACVLRLAADGARVAVNYHRSAEGAASAVDQITSAGGQAFSRQGDMTDPADVASLVAETQSQFGAGIDILVHVTGGLIARKTIVEMEADHWAKVIDLNVTSLFHLAKAAAPHMVDGGSIVALASQAGRDGGGPGAVAYAASKGAVMTMTRGLAKELAPAIRVNALCPGMIDTDFHNIFTKPEVREKVADATPMKREGASEDCAELVAFLASDQASFITGACMDINGGMLCS